jgi:hypothetical protein
MGSGYLRAGVTLADTLFAGTWLSRIYLGWTLAIGILNFCQYNYTTTLNITYNVGFSIVDTIVVVIGLGVMAFFGIRADNDLNNPKKALEPKKKILLTRASHDAAFDQTLFVFVLFMSVINMSNTLVFAYGGGGAGLNWLNGHTTTSPNAFNYPLTSSHWGALSASNIQLVTYRSNIHLLGIVQAFVVFGIAAAGSLLGFLVRQRLHDQGLKVRIMATGEQIPLNAVVSKGTSAPVSLDAYGGV